MKKCRVILLAILILVGGLLCRLILDRPQKTVDKASRPHPPVQQTAELKSAPKKEDYSFQDVVRIANKGNAEEAWRKGYSAPVDFWGRAVDEDGHGVAGAKVYFSVNVHPNPYAQPENFETESDGQGYFSLEGKKGAALAVSVVKEGWRVIKAPKGSIAYWTRGVPGYKLPSKENPFLYILRKKGEAAELVLLEHTRYKISKDGIPSQMSLENGKSTVLGKGDLQVEYWQLDEKDEKRHFSWRCRVSVPGGGLALWKGEEGFEFEAPTSGYQEAEEIDMPKTAERWQSFADRKFFVKTASGKYARIRFSMMAEGNFFVVQGYFNPSGSRNLEFDEAKQINK